MTTPPSVAAPRRLWHLLWAVPTALGVTWCAGVWMTLNWCGVSGCSGGGFGRTNSPSLPGVLVGAGVAVVVWVLLMTLAPWHHSLKVRVLTGAIAGVAIAALTLVWATDGLVR